MADINEILGRQISSVKELRNEIKRLQDSLVGLDSESKEFKSTTEKLSYAQEELTRVTSAGKKENIAAKDSIAGLEKSYRDLYKQYKLLSDEQRNSSFGKDMAKQLKDMSDKINDNKVSVGNLTSNIGNYEKAITSAFEKMGISVNGLTKSFGGASEGSKLLGSSFSSLATAGGEASASMGLISAGLGVLIGLFAAAYAGVKQNEELQMRWNEAMAAFEPIINAVKNGLSKLGEVLVKIVEWAGKAYVKLDEIHSKFTDWLGLTDGAVEANKAFQEQVKVTQSLAKAKNDLTIRERAYNVEAAKKSAEVARLRELASETNNAAEKNKLLTQAKELQAEIDDENLAIKQEHLRILQEENELTPNSVKDNEALAQAEIDVANAEARAAQNARMFNRQLNVTKTSASGAETELKKLAEEAKKVNDRTISSNKTELELLADKYKYEKKLLEDHGYDTNLLTREYERSRTKIIIQEREKTAELVVAAQKEELDKLETLYEQTKAKYYDVYDKAAAIKTSADLADFGKLFGLGDVTPQDVENYIESLANAVDEAFTKWQKAYTNTTIGNMQNVKDNLLKELQTYVLSPAVMKEKIRGDLKNYIDYLKQYVEENGFNELEEPFLYYVIGKDWDDPAIWDNLLKDFPATFNTLKAEIENAFGNELVALYEADLDAFHGTTEQKQELIRNLITATEALLEKQEELYNLEKERHIDLNYDIVNSYVAINDAIGSISSSIQSLIAAELKEGEISEAEAKKKIKRLKNLERIQMITGIASVVADTAAGMQGIWAGYAGELAINNETAAAAGPGAVAAKAALDAKSLASAILRTTTMAANGAANIAAIVSGSIAKLKQYDEMGNDSSGSAGVAATPMLIDSNGYSYYQELQLEQNEAILNKPIYVTVTDIQEGLNHKVQVTDESSF